MTLNLLAIAAALLAVMGKVNLAARRAQIGILLQTLGWVLLMVSGQVESGSAIDRLLSTLAMGGIAGGLAYSAIAFDLWCGRATVARAPAIIALIMTVGYCIGFDSYPFRVGWANGLLTLQVALVVVALCRKTEVPVGAWRWLLVASLLVQMVVTASRGVLGAFYTELFPNFFTPHPANVTFALATNVTVVMSLVGILLAHRDEAQRELERQASTDGITGALNRRAWLERATLVVSDSQRLQQPLCVLLLDLDHFKEINDTYGHEAGDRALKLFVDGMNTVGGQRNLVCRYGGEEFSVLKRDADLEAIRAYDQRLRVWLAEAGPRELGMPLTYSAGITLLQGQHDTVESMLRRADSLLYSAKMLGRNRTLDEQALELSLQ
ncbi:MULTISPECIES: diguanylate cyclase [unclassified Duganella]|uniref:GGDEF domain-containing protein n=1 Tax=unclassified Duganella TaxID=2636909 RepID=UPI000880BA7A|nr:MULTISPECIES: diguanylate cyclase [unclassified Duganella]SDH25401.1 diguanylate cyclase (GGDEF) domain-containing protein [Duganella sp. OV458]SDK42802.1 diguanylate cyclase (GGDEF) domain-containing protein [Duganella sp. OV510]